MKKSLIWVLVMLFLLTGCKKEPVLDNPNAKAYTSEEIYLLSYENGYVDNDERFNNMVIENEEQLTYARERSLILPSDKMIEEYPLTEYTYVIEYYQVSSGGYFLKAESLCIGDNYMYFEMTDDSHSPKGEVVECVMGGFLHMAAVPKGYLGDRKYAHWTYPDRNDMYQNEDYCVICPREVFPDATIREIYGENGYLIRSEEEFERFLEMSKEITDSKGTPILVPGTFPNMDDNYQLPDFEQIALLVKFFPGNGSSYRLVGDLLHIKDNQITLSTQVLNEIESKKEQQGSSVFYAHIPKEFLTEESYEGWITP